jgi:hypothetical protein
LGAIAKSGTVKPTPAAPAVTTPTAKSTTEPVAEPTIEPSTSAAPTSVAEPVAEPVTVPDVSPFSVEPLEPSITTPTEPEKSKSDELPPIEVTGTKEIPNVVRDTSGKPITTGSGAPIGAGSSDEVDIAAAQKELDDLKRLSSIPAYKPETSPSLMDIWRKGVDVATGYRGVPRSELGKIQVPESVNTELNDILWLSGRQKK